ncbi:hypothetical protein C1I97_26465 [Streptomyces sp. NTH33]|nr:hypothetical protein C1I97_26465 [Streptomyces sp. NTH33]
MNVIDIPDDLVRTQAAWSATYDALAAPCPVAPPSRPAPSPLRRYEGDKPRVTGRTVRPTPGAKRCPW